MLLALAGLALFGAQDVEAPVCPHDTFFCEWEPETVAADDVRIDFPTIYDAQQPTTDGGSFAEFCGDYRVRRHVSDTNQYLVICRSPWTLIFNSEQFLNFVFYPPMGN